MSDVWHIQYADGRQEKSLTIEQVKERLQQNKFTPRDMVWMPPLNEWRPAVELPGVFNLPAPASWPEQVNTQSSTPAPAPPQANSLNYAVSAGRYDMTPAEERLLKEYALPLGSPMPNPLSSELYQQLAQTGKYMRRVLFWGNFTVIAGFSCILMSVASLLVLFNDLYVHIISNNQETNIQKTISWGFTVFVLYLGMGILLLFCGRDIKKLRAWPFIAFLSIWSLFTLVILAGLCWEMINHFVSNPANPAITSWNSSNWAPEASTPYGYIMPMNHTLVMINLCINLAASVLVIVFYSMAFIAAKKVRQQPRWCMLTIAALNL